MKYKLLFLILTLFFITPIFSQSAFTYVTYKAVFGTNKIAKPKANIASLYSLAPSMLVLPNYYCNHLGFFCKQEIKLQQAIKVPFVFRLGSVQTVDYLEGKRGAHISNR